MPSNWRWQTIDMAFRPELRTINTLGLCAGVGGLELGLRIAEPRARGVAYVEREAYAAAALAARIRDGALHPAAIWSDLATFDPEPWRGVVHCLTSGDPCQPNSVAGHVRTGAPAATGLSPWLQRSRGYLSTLLSTRIAASESKQGSLF